MTNYCSLPLVQNSGIYTTTWEISTIWLAKSKGILTFIWKCHHGNQNHRVTKGMAERFPDFTIQEIQELKKKLQNQDTTVRIVHWPGSMSGPGGLKTRTLKPICSPMKRQTTPLN